MRKVELNATSTHGSQPVSQTTTLVRIRELEHWKYDEASQRLARHFEFDIFADALDWLDELARLRMVAAV